MKIWELKILGYPERIMMCLGIWILLGISATGFNVMLWERV